MVFEYEQNDSDSLGKLSALSLAERLFATTSAVQVGVGLSLSAWVRVAQKKNFKTEFLGAMGAVGNWITSFAIASVVTYDYARHETSQQKLISNSHQPGAAQRLSFTDEKSGRCSGK